MCILLTLTVFLVFGRTLGCGFVFDDSVYVSKNPIVQRGLTWEGFRWALTYNAIGHWHPLTWLSHMLDCQLYGLNPAGHHLTNILLHTATVVLLFLVLYEMTCSLWRSAFVAAVFAVHPLRVESVAWVAERKDVLSAFFFMLTLAAYLRYVRQPSVLRYAAVMLCFALGLLSKNMLVTLPFVILLLDYWPLNRMRNAECAIRNFAGLLVEKIPLLALTIGSCVMTFLTPEKVSGFLRLPFALRLENAAVSYVTYIGQMFYPSALACLYPNPTADLPLGQVVGALALLLVISAMVWAFRKPCPWLFVGWFWYLGMLIPVIGIVQISFYAHADRYTYLPQIGLYIVMAWAVTDLTSSRRYGRPLLATVGVVVIIALSVCTWRQIAYWRDDESLWRHAIACTARNYIAYNNLGYGLAAEGRTAEAIEQYQNALELNPDFADGNNNLGTAFLDQGRLDKALEYYRRALAVDPNFAEAENNLGILFAKQGKPAEAIEHYQKAIEFKPTRAEFYGNLGNLLAGQGRASEAIPAFEKALEIAPDNATFHYEFANVCFSQGNWDEAINQYQQALKQMPDSVHARYQLGLALQCRGHFAAAIEQFQQVIKLNPLHVTAQNNLAWMLATCPEASLRNGPKAVEMARRAVQLSAGTSPQILDTLAAAYAEAGRFPEAVETARQALDLSVAQKNGTLADVLQNQLKLFENHVPYHEKPQ
ncbi:MAG TPA: tetratricopeptide repeat protein [Candidatus Sulfopaludibacter sp.]|nr:tetratricopeptide repeat protein [Candidatus Sulfopaludibacter sp.]